MKIKLGVFFGGKSVEHEIAIITYTQALESINNDKYEVLPIYITKQGVLYTGEDLFDLENFKDMDVLLKRCYPVTIVNTGKTWEVVRVHPHLFSKKILNTIDVAFPIVHGTNCEDGTVAGYLNLLGIPYVGPDVLASSIGMDKILMKKVLKESGLPVVDYVAFYSSEYIKDDCVVIDVGINRDENNKLCGDVDFENVKDKCSFITPVPGGVGPMTIAMLMQNTITAAKLQNNIKKLQGTVGTLFFYLNSIPEISRISFITLLTCKALSLTVS